MSASKKFQLLLLAAMLVLPIFLFYSPFAALFGKGILVLLSVLTALWLVSLAVKDASIIDIFWGFGFVIIVWFYAYQIDNFGVRQYLLLSLVSIWGLRLSLYLAGRNIGKGEDYRYVQMRKAGGKNWWWTSFFRVFFLQGWILWIISSVFVPALADTSPLGVLDYIGVSLWAIGFFFEVVGDYQLSQFKKNRSSSAEVLATGLWKYTRHPNYFGDTTLWWGYFFLALSFSTGWIHIFSPLFMTFLLLKISGVAMLEKGLSKTKPKYEDYIRRTSAFIPLPPKE
ncbi:MAG: DUF1295 domain-containing protein [Saprospiraceae bacterium]